MTLSNVGWAVRPNATILRKDVGPNGPTYVIHRCVREKLSTVLFYIFLHLYSLSGWSATHHPEAFLKSITGSKTEGMQIVQHYCLTCHAEKPLISLGAPRMGKKTDWQPRLRQGFKQLFKHTNEGYHAMPARGGCFECTDQQLMLAILKLIKPE